MGCSSSKDNSPFPVPQPENKPLTAAEEAAAINAQIAAKLAAKPHVEKEAFERKFQKKKGRHDIHRRADEHGTAGIRKSEVKQIQDHISKLARQATNRASRALQRVSISEDRRSRVHARFSRATNVLTSISRMTRTTTTRMTTRMTTGGRWVTN